MDADDFRDYMLSFLFLRYLSDNYETAAMWAATPARQDLHRPQRQAPHHHPEYLGLPGIPG
jgi:type I restriction enzyme M protein